MPRRREVPKREILPDPKFGNVELSKFMNVIMEGGRISRLGTSRRRGIFHILLQLMAGRPIQTPCKFILNLHLLDSNMESLR